jgi:hypothetical protein
MRSHSTRIVIACLLAAAILPAAGCGSSPKLDRGDANSVQADRADLATAARTTQRILNPSTARALVKSVTHTLAAYNALSKATASTGSGQVQQSLSEGIATGALEEIQKDVPSLVPGGPVSPGSASTLDTDAARAFLANAIRHPRAALHGPASDTVNSIIRTVEGKPANTQVPTLHGETVDEVLRQAAEQAHPYWPDLAARLDATRRKLK